MEYLISQLPNSDEAFTTPDFFLLFSIATTVVKFCDMVSIKAKQRLRTPLRKSALKSRVESNVSIAAKASAARAETAQQKQKKQKQNNQGIDSKPLNEPFKPILSVSSTFRQPPPAQVRPLVQAALRQRAALQPGTTHVPQLPKLNRRPAVLESRGKPRLLAWLAKQAAKALARKLRRGRRPRRQLKVRYSNIVEFQRMLGLRGAAETIPDVTFVSLDLEWVERKSHDHVTEIGISILRAKDVQGVPFGPYGNGWLEKMQHHHIVIWDVPGRRESRRAIFAKSEHHSIANAKARIFEIMQSLTPGHLVIVGQSVDGDIVKLRTDPAFEMDILKGGSAYFHSIVDTLELSQAARDEGAQFFSMRLGVLARFWGIDPKFHSSQLDVFGKSSGVYGVHNASNDAAYALMTAMLTAMRWNDVIQDQSAAKARWVASRGTKLSQPVPVMTPEARGEDFAEEVRARREERLKRGMVRTHSQAKLKRKEKKRQIREGKSQESAEGSWFGTVRSMLRWMWPFG